MQEYMERNPVDYDSRDGLSLYLCTMHNVLNAYLKKPIFDCNLLEKVYGSECDECKLNKKMFDL